MLTKQLQSYFTGISQLLYPVHCNGCGSDLVTKNELLCFECINKLPETYFADKPDNYVEKIFYGRINIVAATGLYFFNKDTLLQVLLHQLKYKGNQQIGEYFGKLMAITLRESGRFAQLHYLIPIPLSKQRLKKRGYNQALAICSGMATVLQIPVLDNITLRTKHNQTQTNKTRQQRWDNMQAIFEIENTQQIEHKNILLVDDVITTGATLEACGEILVQVAGVQLYIAVLAVATN